MNINSINLANFTFGSNINFKKNNKQNNNDNLSYYKNSVSCPIETMKAYQNISFGNKSQSLLPMYRYSQDEESGLVEMSILFENPGLKPLVLDFNSRQVDFLNTEIFDNIPIKYAETFAKVCKALYPIILEDNLRYVLEKEDCVEACKEDPKNEDLTNQKKLQQENGLSSKENELKRMLNFVYLNSELLSEVKDCVKKDMIDFASVILDTIDDKAAIGPYEETDIRLDKITEERISNIIEEYNLAKLYLNYDIHYDMNYIPLSDIINMAEENGKINYPLAQSIMQIVGNTDWFSNVMDDTIDCVEEVRTFTKEIENNFPEEKDRIIKLAAGLSYVFPFAEMDGKSYGKDIIKKAFNPVTGEFDIKAAQILLDATRKIDEFFDKSYKEYEQDYKKYGRRKIGQYSCYSFFEKVMQEKFKTLENYMDTTKDCQTGEVNDINFDFLEYVDRTVDYESIIKSSIGY